MTGRTGNEILARTTRAAIGEGLQHSTYTHPVGFFGHAAGPDHRHVGQPGPVPVSGDWPLAANTAYAIEGNVKVAVPEWNGQLVQIKLEQTALFDGTTVPMPRAGRPTWHVVR